MLVQLAALEVFGVLLELLAASGPLFVLVVVVVAKDEVAEPPLSCWLISSNSNSSRVGVNILFIFLPLSIRERATQTLTLA